jgi:hypothetical protein
MNHIDYTHCNKTLYDNNIGFCFFLFLFCIVLKCTQMLDSKNKEKLCEVSLTKPRDDSSGFRLSVCFRPDGYEFGFIFALTG